MDMWDLRRLSGLQAPLAIDALDQYIVLATAPLEIVLLRVQIQGAVSATGNPSAQLTVIRELSILSAGSPLRVPKTLDPIDQFAMLCI